jgi:hypothetical protein
MMKLKASSKASATHLPLVRQPLNMSRVLGILLLMGSCVFLPACKVQKPEPPKIEFTKAQKKFEAKCRDEFGLHVKTRIVGDTLWIYLPVKEPMFDLKSDKPLKDDPEKKPSPFALQYIEGEFKDGIFSFEYDVIERKKANIEEFGYHNDYTDSFSKKQTNLFTAVNETLFDAKDTPDEPAPKFVVMAIADITKGIELKYSFYLEDYRRFNEQSLPPDEYNKRILQDVKGSQEMVGDEIGEHLDYKNINMGEFLAKQIANRVRFKYQSTTLKTDNHDNLITGIIADTTRYYSFEDFKEVRLSNLRTDQKFIFTKDQLANFGDDQDYKGEPKGKLIRIRFDHGKAEISE